MSGFVNFIFSYDDEKDQVTSYQKIYLEDLDRIEIGLYSARKIKILNTDTELSLLLPLFLFQWFTVIHGDMFLSPKIKALRETWTEKVDLNLILNVDWKMKFAVSSSVTCSL